MRTYWAWDWSRWETHRFRRKVDRDAWVAADPEVRDALRWSDLGEMDHDNHIWHASEAWVPFVPGGTHGRTRLLHP